MPPVSTGFPLVSSECLFLVHILVHIGGFWPIFGPCLASSSPDSEGIGEWRRGSELNRRIQLLQSRALPLGYPAHS